jgi:hypothetical protein
MALEHVQAARSACKFFKAATAADAGFNQAGSPAPVERPKDICAAANARVQGVHPSEIKRNLLFTKSWHSSLQEKVSLQTTDG